MEMTQTINITDNITENGDDFHHYSNLCSKRVEDFLQKFLLSLHSSNGNTEDPPEPLFEALRYSLFNGGKRLRPLLVYAAGEAFQTPLELLHAPAAAVELIHCFSLVHDDLPAMDNDDYRRGKLTCHKVFGEANAILVGDALQSLSFELLSNSEFNPNPLQTQIKMINTLSKAIGLHGMVGGQALDIAAELLNQNEMPEFSKISGFSKMSEFSESTTADELKLKSLIALHRKKTGVLISASLRMGLQASQCQDQELVQGLLDYADLLGLAFQVQDDILDIEGSLETLGKTPGKDAQHVKLTFPHILGLEGAKAYKKMLQQKILDKLDTLGLKTRGCSRFQQITRFFLERNS